jgi:hypothetical protein
MQPHHIIELDTIMAPMYVDRGRAPIERDGAVSCSGSSPSRA